MAQAPLTITFLGTGTSLGVPVIGCDCEVCRSDDPRDRRTRSSIYVQTPECSWVVDTGTDFRMQCIRENVRELDAVLITHAHTDHIMGFDDLRPFCFQGDIPVYAGPETMGNLRRIFEFAFNGQNRFPGYVRPIPYEVEAPFMLGNTRITPLPVKHGRASVLGFLFEREGRKLAAYISDVKEISDPVLEIFTGVDVLIIDALREREHPTHFSTGEALEISRRCGAQRTWFTHLSHESGHTRIESILPETVRLAHDGLKLELGI